MIPITNPWPTNKLMKMIKFIWSIPMGLVGLFLLLLVATCTRIQQIEIDNGAIEVLVGGRLCAYMSGKGWGGFTCGWTIFYWGLNKYTLSARVHERVHVKQYFNYGILFPILYIYYQITRGYRKNPLEIEAYTVDGTLKS